MSYTTYTLASFTAELASALSDPNLVYWTQDELDRATREALLAWGALTSYWTARGQFTTSATPPFAYDMAAVLVDGNGDLLRRREYTMGDLTREIQYHLLEPANGVSGSGMTAQFTISQITNALIRRRNQFVIDSRVPLTAAIFNTTVPPDGRVELDTSIALIQRAAWQDGVSNIWTPLRRTDAYAAQAYSPIYNLSPTVPPYAFSQVESMPGTMDLIPPPQASGNIHLIYAKTLMLAVNDATVMALPDEFVWANKWGAMYELLSTDAPGYDPMRAKYCLERYSSALDIAAAQRSILRVRVNDRPVPLDTFANMDAGRPAWMSQPGTPTMAACSFDLMGFSPLPNAIFGVTADVSATAPLPAASGDYIQVGREEIPYLFDYCRHILTFKMGGSEFVSTMPLYDNFIRGAAQRSTLIAAKARYLTPLFSTPQRQEETSRAA